MTSSRFVQRYEARRAENYNALVRPVRIGIGVLLIVAGALIGWLPGPGFVILALPGAFLLASEVRRAAIILDRVENETIPRLQRLYARLRGAPRLEWVRQDPELWSDWCDRRGQELPDTGDRQREIDSSEGASAVSDDEVSSDEEASG